MDDDVLKNIVYITGWSYSPYRNLPIDKQWTSRRRIVINSDCVEVKLSKANTDPKSKLEVVRLHVMREQIRLNNKMVRRQTCNCHNIHAVILEVKLCSANSILCL